MRLSAVVACSLALSFSIYACSDDPAPTSSGAGGSAGSSGSKATGGKSSSTGGKSGSAGTSAGGKSGSAGSAALGGEGGTGEGGTGEGGTGEGGTGEGGTGEGGTSGAGDGGAGGAPTFHARAKLILTATTGNTLHGTVCFKQEGAVVTMRLAAEDCPAFGDYPMHLHANNVCGADGADAGGHWGGIGGPGEGGSIPLGLLACKNGPPYQGTYEYVNDQGTWTIGGDEATNILNHVMVVHKPDPDTAVRLSCGLPVEIDDDDTDCP